MADIERRFPSSFEAVVDLLVEDRSGNEGLAPGDRHLATLGCLLVAGAASPEMSDFLLARLKEGVAAKRLEAMLIHAVGYLGVVATGSAFRLMCRLLEDAGSQIGFGEVRLPPGEREVRVREGARLYDRFDPGRQAKQAKKFETLSPTYYPRAMELSGLVLADESLILRERQVMTIAMLSSLGGQDDQLRFHIGVGLRNGVSKEVLAGILIVVQAYAGMPRANSAAALALEVIAA